MVAYTYPVKPVEVIRGYWRHRELIWQLTRREVVGRYRGTIFGSLWSILDPLFMLIVYTVVLRVIFGRYWYSETETIAEFAVILFSGLLLFNLFRESINSAPTLVVKNSNYVKKVAFPLEILSCVSLLNALFHLGISLIILLVIYSVVYETIHFTVVYTPLILIPLVLLTFGLSLFLASLGVFLRDIKQVIGMLVMATLFLSAIFYPIDVIPEEYRTLFYLNPVAFTVDQFRAAVVLGRSPDWLWLAFYYPTSLVVVWLGLFWFQKTRKGFSDVL